MVLGEPGSNPGSGNLSLCSSKNSFTSHVESHFLLVGSLLRQLNPRTCFKQYLKSSVNARFLDSGEREWHILQQFLTTTTTVLVVLKMDRRKYELTTDGNQEDKNLKRQKGGENNWHKEMTILIKRRS